jgi:FSR family fosmidomycin resistance protein-like MFS transporter
MSNLGSLHQDVRTMSLVGLAHGLSHFFHLLLPPLFPVFISEFGFNYAQLGFLVSLFFIISGVGQALSGFLVDRVGARPVLFAALGCFMASALAGSLAQGYTGLMLSAALAGLGNAPFHPVDFTILNKRISSARLGHAFSVHGITGSLGWAAAPAFLLGVMALTGGSWRLALGSAAGLVLVVGITLLSQRDALDDRVASEVVARPATASGRSEHVLAFLKLPVVWLCFSFFFWSTSALSAIQSFASPALLALMGVGVPGLGVLLSGYMLCSAGGMVVGGFMAARAERLEKIIGMCLLAAAGLMAWVGTGGVPAWMVVAVVIVSGFGVGLAGPSRDMLIKRAAPPGATGRVYGLVYSGLDIGFALAAPIFGALMDRGLPQGVFFGAAGALGMAVFSATLVGARLAPRVVARKAGAPA